LILVDANVVLDLVTADQTWGPWSAARLSEAVRKGGAFVNNIVFAEISVRYENEAAVESALALLELQLRPMTTRGLFLAGKAFSAYRQQGGTRTGVSPDFFIGAQAADEQVPVLTRDTKRFRTYFPEVRLISPELS